MHKVGHAQGYTRGMDTYVYKIRCFCDQTCSRGRVFTKDNDIYVKSAHNRKKITGNFRRNPVKVLKFCFC